MGNGLTVPQNPIRNFFFIYIKASFYQATLDSEKSTKYLVEKPSNLLFLRIHVFGAGDDFLLPLRETKKIKQQPTSNST